MNRYDRLKRENVLNIKKRDKSYIVREDAHLLLKKSIKLSFSIDNAYSVIEFLKYLDSSSNLPLDITIIDENSKEVSLSVLRYHVLNMLNTHPIINASFELSDSVFYEYIYLLKDIKWRHNEVTNLRLSLDRNPISTESKKNMHIEEAKTKLAIPNDKLIWFTNKSLLKARSKIGSRDVDDAIGLKRSIKSYYETLFNGYDMTKTDEFNIIYLASEYIKDNIKFPRRFIQIDENGIQHLNPEAPNYVSNAYGTFTHSEGVCSGQAKLLQALISNPITGIDACTIEGEIKNVGRHEWVGVVVKDGLVQCCPTLNGPFKPLSRYGYIPDEDNIYTMLYDRIYLTPKDRKKVEEMTLALKRK